MSKKEHKLKKNLYKALTEYFIHNAKNSLSSSESILDQLGREAPIIRNAFSGVSSSTIEEKIVVSIQNRPFLSSNKWDI